MGRLAAAACLWLIGAAGGVCTAHGDLEPRIAALTAHLGEVPQDAAALLARGDLYRQHEHWQAALRDYAAARGLGHPAAELDFREGRVWLESGAPAHAMPLLDRQLARRPDDAPALVTRARARAALGLWLAAAEDLERVQNLLPRPAPDLYVDRARALLRAGPSHEEAAFASLSAGVERLGPVVTLIRVAVDAARERGLHARTLEWLDRLPPALADHPRWLAERANALAALRPAEAAAVYRQALDRIRALPASRRSVPGVRALEARVSASLAVMTEPVAH